MNQKYSLIALRERDGRGGERSEPYQADRRAGCEGMSEANPAQPDPKRRRRKGLAQIALQKYAVFTEVSSIKKKYIKNCIIQIKLSIFAVVKRQSLSKTLSKYLDLYAGVA